MLGSLLYTHSNAKYFITLLLSVGVAKVSLIACMVDLTLSTVIIWDNTINNLSSIHIIWMKSILLCYYNFMHDQWTICKKIHQQCEGIKVSRHITCNCLLGSSNPPFLQQLHHYRNYLTSRCYAWLCKTKLCALACTVTQI